MPTVPLDQKFHTIAANVATKERGSSLVNSQKEIYTMEDITSTVRPYKVLTIGNLAYTNEVVSSNLTLESTLGDYEFNFNLGPNYLTIVLHDYIDSGIDTTKLYISSQQTFNPGYGIFQANIEESNLAGGGISFYCRNNAGSTIPVDMANLEIRIYE
jgi:adenine specific DNA methylase Mod